MYKRKGSVGAGSNEAGYTRLAREIILQAVRDYRAACRTLKRNPRQKEMRQEAEEMRDEVISFFRSQWFTELTDVDGEYLLRKLNEEVGNG